MLEKYQLPEIQQGEVKAKHENWAPDIFQAEIAQRFTFQRIRQLAAEMASRRMEALKLYEPTKDQQAFHASNAQIRVIRGSNRAGKTLASHLEIARAVLGADPHGKYPKRDGRCILVGKDLRHIGQVMWRKLARPGAFKMIRDFVTGEWRAFRPWNAEDLEREAEAKPAPPLIPQRAIASIGWEDKKNNVPSTVVLNTGWEIRCYSSLGKPPNGIDIDLCLSGRSEIYDPVKRQYRRVDSIDGPFHVLSYMDGNIVTLPASKPFIKGYGEIVEVCLSNGEVIHTTRKHQVMTEDEKWVSIQDAYDQGLSLKSIQSCRMGEAECHGLKSPSEQSLAMSRVPLQFASKTKLNKCCEVGHLSTGESQLLSSSHNCASECVRHDNSSTQGFQENYCPSLHQCGEQFHEAQDIDQFSPPSLNDALKHNPSLSLSGDLACKHKCSRSESSCSCEPFSSSCDLDASSRQHFLNTDQLHAEMHPIRGESRQRSCFCRNTWIRPDRHQEFCVSSHQPCGSVFQPLQAIASCNCAKSCDVLSSTPFAFSQQRIADGESLFQATRGTEGGVGDNTFPYCPPNLSTPVIICKITSSFKEEIWDITVPVTHNYIYGKIISHNCIFDEEITDPEWFPEVIARLLDRQGRFVWSATPQAGSDELYDLHERANKDRMLFEKGRRQVEEFVLLLKDNPHIKEEDKLKFAQNLSEEERRVRVQGDFAITSFKVYPEFSMAVHGIDLEEIPAHWTRYAAVDPGHQVCAVLFAAVPPPDESDMIVLYDELYLRDADAIKFAENMKLKVGHDNFQAFIIDRHMAIHTELGRGKTVMQQYSEALEEFGVRSAGTGNGFVLGNDDVSGGIMAVHGGFRIRPDGSSKIRVRRGWLPNFEEEIRRYHKLRVNGVLTDKPNQRKNNHSMDCFDSETEILTENGWIRFAELNGWTKVATVNLKTDQIEYQLPTEVISRHHEGEMIQFGGMKLNGLVTPNHRMVVYPKKGYKGYDNGNPVVKLAKDLTMWDSIKLHAKWTGKECDKVFFQEDSKSSPSVSVDAGDWAEFLGWYIAEGSRARKIQFPGRGYQVIVTQTKEKTKRKLKQLLDRLPWKFNEYKSGFRTNSCKQLWNAVSGIGYQYERRVPRWIMDASPRIIQRFMEGMIAGDGWTQNGAATYATISPKLADDVQELFIKLGKSASVRMRKAVAYCIKGRHGANTKDQYWVREWTCPKGHLRDSKNNPNYKTVEYNGTVYCASVPNGTLIVRRNGKPMVAGNCLRYMVMYEPQYVKVKVKKKEKAGAIKAFRAKEKRKADAEGGSGVNLGPGGGGQWM